MRFNRAFLQDPTSFGKVRQGRVDEISDLFPWRILDSGFEIVWLVDIGYESGLPGFPAQQCPGRRTGAAVVSPSSVESQLLTVTSTGNTCTPRRRASWISYEGV